MLVIQKWQKDLIDKLSDGKIIFINTPNGFGRNHYIKNLEKHFPEIFNLVNNKK